MPFYLWSQTAASNATADPTINWAEGQAPSSANDSARAMMAAAAKYRDDNSGGLTTGGTASAYTLATNQVFDNLTHMDGQSVSFTVHASNAASATLNVDGLGAAFLTNGGNVIPANTLLLGSIYAATYSTSISNWILKDLYGNPFNIPIGAMLPFIGPNVPNPNFVFPLGQAISRTTYATLFAMVGTTFGAGDGSTTFNVPDMGGRVFAGKEATATRLTTAGGGVDGGTLGATGGTQNGTIGQVNLPSVNLTTDITETAHHHQITGLGTVAVTNGTGASQGNLLTTSGGSPATLTTSNVSTGLTAITSLGGSGTAFKIVQPTFVGNFILRVI